MLQSYVRRRINALASVKRLVLRALILTGG
jgi:hypothetical protein